ncbi:MAG TPA: DUF4124 domain-containing protein [Gammaproteobacteria bacterium]|nr:DUF4124 domain-containing protein [Gammaproteobacteria bacterium]
MTRYFGAVLIPDCGYKMMRAIQIVGMLTMILLAHASIADNVFRSVDENGLIIYSDRPSLNGQNEEVFIRIVRSNTTAIKADRVENAELAAAVRIRKEFDSEARDEQQSLQAAAAERKANNCVTAMNTQQKYNTNRRLYKELPNGEREYLSDDELDAARADAARNVKKWCS